MPARQDSTTDPAVRAALLLARHGQASYARALSEVKDEMLDEPSLRANWSRRQLVALVGLRARRLAAIVEAAASGPSARAELPLQPAWVEVEFTATLPSEALRNLAAHAAIHLNVEWRDLAADAWDRTVVDGAGAQIRVADTVLLRAGEVWTAAVDLDTGVTVRDLPDAVRALPGREGH